VDVLVAHGLATGSPAGDLLWTRAFEPNPPPRGSATVRRNVDDARSDGRETAIVAKAGDGYRLLVEDKAVGGHFEDRQAASYKAAVDADSSGRTRSCLVAPRAFIDAFKEGAALFSGRVSLEELARVLSHAVDATADPASELALGYAYRSERYRACADPRQASRQVFPPAVAFGEGHRLLAEQVSQRRLAVGDFRGPAGRRIGFAPWRRGVALWHNLNPGTIDLYVPLRTWTGEALRVWLGNLPAGQQPPSGWSVTRAGAAVVVRYTGFPVLDISSFEAARPDINKALLWT
jgi:hypothetical protein